MREGDPGSRAAVSAVLSLAPHTSFSHSRFAIRSFRSPAYETHEPGGWGGHAAAFARTKHPWDSLARPLPCLMRGEQASKGWIVRGGGGGGGGGGLCLMRGEQDGAKTLKEVALLVVGHTLLQGIAPPAAMAWKHLRIRDICVLACCRVSPRPQRWLGSTSESAIFVCLPAAGYHPARSAARHTTSEITSNSRQLLEIRTQLFIRRLFTPLDTFLTTTRERRPRLAF
jgi:hypothetical protein